MLGFIGLTRVFFVKASRSSRVDEFSRVYEASVLQGCELLGLIGF